jgi:hypothetical protein
MHVIAIEPARPGRFDAFLGDRVLAAGTRTPFAERFAAHCASGRGRYQTAGHAGRDVARPDDDGAAERKAVLCIRKNRITAEARIISQTF